MKEQLPTPLSELIVLNLFLGSISYLIGLIFIVLVLRANQFSWLKLVLISCLTVALSLVASFVIWAFWPSSIYLMIGPIHLSTFISVTAISLLLLKVFGNKIRLRRTKKPFKKQA